MWRRPILQLGSNTTGQWGCFSLRQAGADGGELIKCPLKTVTFGATRAFHVTSNRNDRSRQPTGRGGTISPYRRLPFVQDRGPPPGVDLSLQERLDKLFPDDGPKVDIGFKREMAEKEKEGRSRVTEWRRKVRADKELEKKARDGTLQVDLDVVRNQWVESGEVFDQIYQAADLYGIFEDLFQYAHFWPCLMLQVEWLQEDGETLVPVHRGNLVKPGECKSAPEVTWNSSDKSLWTLAMVGPDSHLQGEGEVLHWLVANIPGNKVDEGQTLAPYLQPHPPYGTGYHRFVFLLFKQEGKIEMDSELRSDPFNLKDRTFSTLDFYSTYQDHMTPAGLSFCQADYEESLRNFFHHTLNMKEPRYEYEFADDYVKPWRNFFPDQEEVGFDEFLNRHRDPKDIEKEVLEKKLAQTDPFKGDRDADLQFPGLHDKDLYDMLPTPIGEKKLNSKQSFKVAQWRRNAIMRERKKEGYFATYDHKSLRRDPSHN